MSNIEKDPIKITNICQFYLWKKCLPFISNKLTEEEYISFYIIYIPAIIVLSLGEQLQSIKKYIYAIPQKNMRIQLHLCIKTLAGKTNTIMF